MKYFNEASMVIGIVGGFLASALGGWDILLKVFIVAIVADYVTGVIVAFMEHKLSSEIGFKGLMKKVLMIVAVSFAYNLQAILTLPLREIVLMFFIANEGISFVENLGNAGVPLPPQIKTALIQLKSNTENKAVPLIYPNEEENSNGCNKNM